MAALFIDSPVFDSHSLGQRHNHITLAHSGPLPPSPLRECCNLYKHIKVRLRKHTQLHCRTGGCRVTTAVDKVNSTPPTISVPCHGPRSNWKVNRAMDKGSSTLPPSSVSNLPVPNVLTTMQWKTGIHFMKKTSPKLHQHYLSQ